MGLGAIATSSMLMPAQRTLNIIVGILPFFSSITPITGNAPKDMTPMIIMGIVAMSVALPES